MLLTRIAVDHDDQLEVMGAEIRDYTFHIILLCQKLGDNNLHLDLVEQEQKGTINKLKATTHKNNLLEAEIRQLTIGLEVTNQRVDEVTEDRDELAHNFKAQAKENVKLHVEIDGLKATAKARDQAAAKFNSGRIKVLE